MLDCAEFLQAEIGYPSLAQTDFLELLEDSQFLGQFLEAGIGQPGKLKIHAYDHFAVCVHPVTDLPSKSCDSLYRFVLCFIGTSGPATRRKSKLTMIMLRLVVMTIDSYGRLK